MNDSYKWNFSNKTVFFTKDIRKFIPVVRMPVDSILREENVPFSRLCKVVRRIEMLM